MRTNYEKFFIEKTADHQKKTQRAAMMYNERQEMMHKTRMDRTLNYLSTTNNSIADANEKVRMREQTEYTIRELEDMENQLLSTMQ